MNTAKFTIDGRELTVRYLEREGVQDILNEVFRIDQYGLGKLHATGAELRLVLDVGAHMGFVTAVIHHYWPDCAVIAFEPEADLIPVIEANSNGKTTVFPMAVRYDSRKDLYISPCTGGSMIYEPEVNFCDSIPERYKKVQVGTTTLEEVVPHDLSVDLMKIDVEGSEFNILSSMSRKQGYRIKAMVGEYHHIAGYRYIERIIEYRFPHLAPSLLSNDPEAPQGIFQAM